MARTIVGVLRGGTQHFDVSLKNGVSILQALPEDDYDVRDILIDKTGAWHLRGVPMDPLRIVSQHDVILNALCSGIGEDGTVARLLTQAGVPYVGSRPLPTALAHNRILARDVFVAAKILTPQSMTFMGDRLGDVSVFARRVFERFGPPYVVKPQFSRLSHGLLIAPTIRDLPYAIITVLQESGGGLIEEYIPGEEASAGVIEGFRDEALYALPPAHTPVPGNDLVIRHDHHRTNALTHHAPSPFSFEEKERLIDSARRAHGALGLAHSSRSHFRIRKGRPYLLEVESLPLLNEGAPLPVMLDAVGATRGDYLSHLIERVKS